MEEALVAEQVVGCFEATVTDRFLAREVIMHDSKCPVGILQNLFRVGVVPSTLDFPAVPSWVSLRSEPESHLSSYNWKLSWWIS